MISTGYILDNCMVMMTDTTSTARAKLLAFLNMGMQDLARMRYWSFLMESEDITLTNGVGLWPADYQEAVSWTVGDTCIYHNARLTGKTLASQQYKEGYGVTTDGTGFTIYPAADSCTLTYKKAVPVYTDSTLDTVFPVETLEYFVRYCLSRFYEFDMDERAASSITLLQMALKELKTWENRQNGLPRREQRSILWSNT